MGVEDHAHQVGRLSLVGGDQVGRQRRGGHSQPVLELDQMVPSGDELALHLAELGLAGVQFGLQRGQVLLGGLEAAGGALDLRGVGRDCLLQRRRRPTCWR